MTFDPAEWHAVGLACAAGLKDATPEASRRTAVARAYYAALLTVKRRIEAVQGAGVVPEEGIHSAVPWALERSQVRPFLKAINVLRKLREDREAADYVLNAVPLTDSAVDDALERSRRLLVLLGSIPDDRYRNLRFRS